MKNGLYSIHVTLLDGRVGKGSGVIMFRDGQILGGDAYLFYTGSYTTKDNTFKGEVLVQRHTTPRDNDSPLFGGPNPVGIGVARTFSETPPVVNGTPLVRHVQRNPRGDERHRAGRQGQPDFWRHPAQASRHRLTALRHYSAASSIGATRGRMICTRVPAPGSESRSSRPPSRVVTML